MDELPSPVQAARLCVGCRSELGPAALACVACGQLVHADELKRLAGEAESASRDGDLQRAVTAWRSALDLLPANSRQHARITAKVIELSRAIDASPATKTAKSPASSTSDRSTPMKWLAGIGAVALFLLSKGKILFLGLTKAGTAFSMILSLGVYWTAFGWKLAAGLVVSLYVHEMGHVASLRRFGIHASAPMFIPGLGAFVRLKQYPADTREDARVGLAGPMWGLAAAVAFLAAGHLFDQPVCLAIAHVGAWINLFNLIPVWQLDGARGFRALSQGQRWLATAAIGVAYMLNGDGLFILILALAVVRTVARDAPLEGDRRALWEYVGLVLCLALVAQRH